jgi:farnesyl-diphosphate farnesyltransferase
MNCGYGHYKGLMAQFNTVVEVFLQLDEQYQDVIADITKRMGAGMADFIQREVCCCVLTQ